MIALLVITDGRRDCIQQTIPSALASLQGPITRRVIYDDSGDETHRRWLRNMFPSFDLIWHQDGRQGFGGAIREAWRRLQAIDETYLFHCEDDFTFNRCIPLEDMADVLLHHPDLVQLVLRRQPWNPEEQAAGGIVEQHPDDYIEREWKGRKWLSHRRFFSTNPCLYRSDLIRQEDWPQVPHSEGMFTHQLLRDPRVTFGFWGARDSGEWVQHIGHQRNGTGY